jgi:gamma-glutamylcyclotransferase (GGCT)/AIG2-like uncharacterized protein YtfP
MEEAYLFVYGTLRKGFSLAIPEQIAAHIQWIGPGEVKGKLYNIGQYPGAVPDPSGECCIKGEIVKITNSATVFEFLDNYEGFNENDVQGSEYRRIEEWIKLEAGEELQAWIYWYNLPVGNKMRIRENDYITFLQKNQLA